MMRYILRTEYNSVFRHDDSPWGSCNQSVSGSDRFCRILTQNSSLCQIGHFWLYSVQCFRLRLKQCHCVWATRKPHNDIREHWKNDEILFQNVYGHRESVVLRVQVMLITSCFW